MYLVNNVLINDYLAVPLLMIWKRHRCYIHDVETLLNFQRLVNTIFFYFFAFFYHLGKVSKIKIKD